MRGSEKERGLLDPETGQELVSGSGEGKKANGGGGRKRFHRDGQPLDTPLSDQKTMDREGTQGKEMRKGGLSFVLWLVSSFAEKNDAWHFSSDSNPERAGGLLGGGGNHDEKG